jgi:predicted DNA-binding protein (UPF0251 family)
MTRPIRESRERHRAAGSQGLQESAEDPARESEKPVGEGGQGIELERFFRSQWYACLTSVDGELLIRKLQRGGGTMTPKQYLMQAKHLDALIDARLREIDYWREMSTSISGPRFDGMPHNPNRPADAGFVTCLDKVAEIQADVEKKVAQLIYACGTRSTAASTWSLSPEEQLVLRYRYVDNCTWEEIGTLMNVSERTVFRIHGSACSISPCRRKVDSLWQCLAVNGSTRLL